MKWDGSIDINLPEFPDVAFRWSYGEMVAVKGNEITSLYTGMPIWNSYFCDLTGDDLPELCSTISWGSGMIDNRVIIYDYANGVSYSLEDRGVSDYTLRQDESDGQLYVDKKAHIGGGLLSTGRLVFEDDCLQVLWPETPNDSIREITDPTDNPNFAYDTAVEKTFEDENNEYFIGGLYSQHIIVHYTDSTQENIVTALNAGRATFADLDKFGIRYWAEPKADPLEAAISAAILEHYRSNMPDGLLHVESHVILHQETEQTGKTTVYAMSLLDKYGFAGALFHEVESWYEPVILTFEHSDQRGYLLSDSWFPTRPAGSWDALSEEIYKQFSAHSEDLADRALLALMDDIYRLDLKRSCYDQAVRYAGVDTHDAIGYLFEMIEDTPGAEASDPWTYINRHPDECRRLVYFGNYTLDYVFSEFLAGGQTGLRGHLMRIVLDDLAPEAQLRLYAETGQEYFDEWKAGAIRISEQHDMDWIKENQPAIWLFLRMGGE